jgi:hypothetical protein
MEQPTTFAKLYRTSQGIEGEGRASRENGLNLRMATAAEKGTFEFCQKRSGCIVIIVPCFAPVLVTRLEPWGGHLRMDQLENGKKS